MRAKKNYMLDVVLDGLYNNLSVNDICKKYNINRCTYYRWRKEIIITGVSLLKEQEVSNNTGDSLLKLKEQNNKLQRKVNHLEQEKAAWEFRHKWLCWQLEEADDPYLRSFLQYCKS